MLVNRSSTLLSRICSLYRTLTYITLLPYSLTVLFTCIKPNLWCWESSYQNSTNLPLPSLILTGGWIFIHLYSLPTYKISTVISIGSLHKIKEAYFSWDSKTDDNFVFPSMYNYGHFYFLEIFFCCFFIIFPRIF